MMKEFVFFGELGSCLYDHFWLKRLGWLGASLFSLYLLHSRWWNTSFVQQLLTFFLIFFYLIINYKSKRGVSQFASPPHSPAGCILPRLFAEQALSNCYVEGCWAGSSSWACWAGSSTNVRLASTGRLLFLIHKKDESLRFTLNNYKFITSIIIKLYYRNA